MNNIITISDVYDYFNLHGCSVEYIQPFLKIGYLYIDVKRNKKIRKPYKKKKNIFKYLFYKLFGFYSKKEIINNFKNKMPVGIVIDIKWI